MEKVKKLLVYKFCVVCKVIFAISDYTVGTLRL